MRFRDLKEKFSDVQPEMHSGTDVMPVGPGGRRIKPAKYHPDQNMMAMGHMRNILKKEQWTLLGDGLYGAAFTNPQHPDWILKVFSPKDQGYIRFYSMAKRSENPHFPHVSRMGWIDYEDEDTEFPSRMYSVMIERLRPVETEREAGEVEAIIMYTSRYMAADGQYISRMRNPAIQMQVEQASKFKYVFDRYPDLEEACDQIGMIGKPKAPDGSYNLDLHDENVMFRGNVPVITDPFTFTPFNQKKIPARVSISPTEIDRLLAELEAT